MQNLPNAHFHFRRCAMSKEHTIRSLAEEFILYKQHLGCIYETPGYYLMNYVGYTEKNWTGETLPKKESVTGYLNTLAYSPGSLYGTVAVLREFGRHLIKRGYPNIYIIPPKTVRQQTPKSRRIFLLPKKLGVFSKYAILSSSFHTLNGVSL